MRPGRGRLRGPRVVGFTPGRTPAAPRLARKPNGAQVRPFRHAAVAGRRDAGRAPCKATALPWAWSAVVPTQGQRACDRAVWQKDVLAAPAGHGGDHLVHEEDG